MEILNKKQRIILILLGIVMLIFIGYYFTKKTEDSNYSEIQIMEDNNIIQNTISNEEQEDKQKQRIIIHITGEVNNEGIITIEERR